MTSVLASSNFYFFINLKYYTKPFISIISGIIGLKMNKKNKFIINNKKIILLNKN